MTAFVDVAVVPMDSERVLPHQTVLVEQGRITAVGSVTQVPVPAGARRIEGQGHYLLPGLADMHQHVSPIRPDTAGPLAQLPPDSIVVRRLFELLADGVTTVRNLDYIDPDKWPPAAHACVPPWARLRSQELLRLRARAAAGTLWSPRLYVAGQWAPPQYIRPAHWCAELALPAPRLDSVAAYVAAYKAEGYDFIKVHEEGGMSLALFDSVLAAARAVGLPVVGHAPNLAHALAGGIRSIEHLTAYEGAVPDSVGVWAAATQQAGVWNVIPGGGGGNPTLIQALQAAGAGLLLGTDEPLGGTVHGALAYLVHRAGLTPYQALLTSTRNVAEYFGILDEAGTVAVGKRADLVLLTGNPLEDIHHTRHSAGVMIGGRWLARAELDQRLAAMQAAGGTGRPSHNEAAALGSQPGSR